MAKLEDLKQSSSQIQKPLKSLMVTKLLSQKKILIPYVNIYKQLIFVGGLVIISPTPMPQYEMIQNRLLALTESLFLTTMEYGHKHLNKFTKIPCQMQSTISLLIIKWRIHG